MALCSGNSLAVISDHDVSSISPIKSEWTIIAKVIRVWISYTIHLPTAVDSLEMVLMDTKGVKIHASIHQSLLFKFQHLISENCVYSVSNFNVVENDGSFKTTRHGFKIKFTVLTEVARLTEPPITASPFTFAPFSQIVAKSQDPDYFVDVIGILSAAGPVLEWENKDSVKKKCIQIDLESERSIKVLKMECILFDSYADEVSNYLSKDQNTISVVVIQFAKMRNSKGVRSIEGPTKLIFNPTIDEAAHLELNFLERSVGLTKGLRPIEDRYKSCLRKTFFTPSSIKTIDEILVTKEISSCVTLGKIKFFAPTSDWWFPSANSKKCIYCMSPISSIIPKYHIPVVVAHRSGMATFVICDVEAARLLGKSCADLIENHYEGVKMSSMPDELCSLIGRTFLFKIVVNNSAMYNHVEQFYPVQKLCWDSDIINDFKIMYPKFSDLNEPLDKSPFVTARAIFDLNGRSSVRSLFARDMDVPSTSHADGKDPEYVHTVTNV